MPIPSNSRNDFLDYLKGSLIFLVAWGHLIQFIGYQGQPGYYQNPLFKFIYSFHMPLFMAVSGYFSFRTIAQADWRECVWRRFRQVIVPAICWPPLYVITKFTIFVLMAGTWAGGGKLFREFMMDYRPGYWFLWAVFVAAAIVAGLRKFRLDRLEYFAAVTFAMLFAPEAAYFYLVKYTFPFFCVGYALAKGDQISLPRMTWPVVVFLMVGSLGCYFLWNHDSYVYTTRMRLTSDNLSNITLRWVAGFVVSGFFLLLVFLAYRCVKLPFFSGWGRRSLDIYIIHVFLVEMAAGLIKPTMGSPWVCWLMAPVLAIMICFLSVGIANGLVRCGELGAFLLGRVSKGASLENSVAVGKT